MENRNIQNLFQTFLDFKASGSTDVLQVDTAEAGSKIGHGFDDFLGVLCVQADGNGIDIAEFLE